MLDRLPNICSHLLASIKPKPIHQPIVSRLRCVRHKGKDRFVKIISNRVNELVLISLLQILVSQELLQLEKQEELLMMLVKLDK